MLKLGLEKLAQVPWYFPETIKKRAVRYLVQRYVGQFLESSISLEKLTIDIAEGTGTVRDVALNIYALNDVAEQLNLPFVFLEGFVAEISVSIPWQALLSENCFVEISGLTLTLHPKERSQDVSSVDSMIESMTSSMQIAQECLSQVDKDSISKDEIFIKNNVRAVEGVEQLAQAIDTVLNRIKVRFLNSVVKIEYMPLSSDIGIGLEVHFKSIDYFDEAGLEKEKPKSENGKAHFEPFSFTSKKFHIEGVSFYIEEFPTRPEDDQLSPKTEDSTLNPEGSSSSDPILIESTIELGKSFIKKNNHIHDSSKILFAKLIGRQEIRIALKQNEEVHGPKINCEANCGFFLCFLSPRQIHQLMELFDGIISPEEEENSPTKPCSTTTFAKDKAMTKGDFCQVENEFLRTVASNHNMFDLTSYQGWSSPNDESEEEFYPIGYGSNLPDNVMNTSHLSDCSDMQSSCNSTSTNMTFQCTPSNTHNPSKNMHKGRKEINSSNIILTSLKVKFSSALFIILHDDILVAPQDDGNSLSSILDMQMKAETFFTSLSHLSLTGHSCKEFEELHEKINGVCSLSHLRILASPLTIDGTEKMMDKRWMFNSNLTLGFFDIKEYLFSPKSLPKFSNLFKFIQPVAPLNGIYTCNMKPKVTISLKQIKSSSPRLARISIPKTEVHISLDPCIIEIDISIIDRISSLLNRKKILVKAKDILFSADLPPSHINKQNTLKDLMDDHCMKADFKLNVAVTGKLIEFKFRFPIPDFRPVSDMNRVPWWKRNVRKDILTIRFEEFNFETNLQGSASQANYEVRCQDAHVLFQEKEENTPIPILRAMVQRGMEKGFDPVRILFSHNPAKPSSSLDDYPVKENLMSKSMMGFLEDVSQEEFSPFSIRKVASRQKDNVIEELTGPASKEEMNKFMDNCLQNVNYQLDIILPVLHVLLPSKHICEVLYNRLASDLLLWEPCAPLNSKSSNSNGHGFLDGMDIASTFKPNMKSVFNTFHANDLDSFMNENSDDDDNVSFFSVYENKHTRDHNIDESLNGQTFFALCANIGKATAILKTPYRDSDDKVLPGRHGEIIIHLNDTCIFSASGYKGNFDVSYVCALSDKATMYHKSNNVCSNVQAFNLGSPVSFRNFNKVLYPSESIVKLRSGIFKDNSADGSVAIAVKMDFDPIENMKTCLFAGGLRGMTLRHYMTKSSESWLSQLGDMFTIEDYPIAGYVMHDVVTELNFHTQHCSIDYRPLNLPIKTLVTIDSLSLLSNLSVSSNTSVLYFIIEDVALFLQNSSLKRVDLRDFVCVADLDVFEFCLKLMEESPTKPPYHDLKVSNNVLHIRTCSDSCRALLELIIYLGNDGDLIQEPSEKNDKEPSDIILQPSESEETIYSPMMQAQSNQYEIVRTMMQEAMLESSPPKKCVKDDNLGKDVEMFFFPDENNKGRIFHKQHQYHGQSSFIDAQSALTEALKEATTENGVMEDFQNSSDEDYCILDCYTGTGIKSNTGIPQVKPYSFSRIDIKSDYFGINGKTCVKRSDNNLKPELKYLLQELTVIWHLYDGHDFENDKNHERKIIKDNNGNNSSLKQTPLVSFSNDEISIIEDKNYFNHVVPTYKANHNMSWYCDGGPGRDKTVAMEILLSKIKFHYEVYPESSDIKCKYSLGIHDIEIRDKLHSSKINKFLYQYSSESCPRQSHANMLQVKAVTHRSEDDSSFHEMDLGISVRPIRLNVDQDALFFLCKFFEALLISEKDCFAEEELPQMPSYLQAPILSVNMNNLSQFSSENQQLLINVDDKVHELESKNCNQNSPPIFVKSFQFSPDVPIKIDYHGKHIDINSQYGAFAGLLIGIGQLNNSEVRLKRFTCKSGILGLNKLTNLLLDEWQSDIRRNQLPSILGGIGPMSSFVKLFGGVRDLFWLPIEQYQKDGRIFRGLQKGTSAFASSSAHAALDLTGRFVGCIQSTAETMYDMVSSGPSVRNRRGSSYPQDIREGVTTAFDLVKEGLGDSANAIVKAAAEEHSHKGMSGAVGGVLRQIPPTVVQPIILASEATCTVLGGMKNQLVPDARREAAEKWKA